MTGVVVPVVSSTGEGINVVLSVVTEYTVSVDVSVGVGIVTGVDVLKGVVEEHGTKTQQRILIW